MLALQSDASRGKSESEDLGFSGFGIHESRIKLTGVLKQAGGTATDPGGIG